VLGDQPQQPCNTDEHGKVDIFRVEWSFVLKLMAEGGVLPATQCRVYIKAALTPQLSDALLSADVPDPLTWESGMDANSIFKTASGSEGEPVNWFVVTQKIGYIKSEVKITAHKPVTEPVNGLGIFPCTDTFSPNKPSPVGKLSVFFVSPALAIKIFNHGESGNPTVDTAKCKMFAQADALPSFNSVIEFAGGQQPAYKLADGYAAATTWFFVGKKEAEDEIKLMITVTADVTAATATSAGVVKVCEGETNSENNIEWNGDKLRIFSVVSTLSINLIADTNIDPTKCRVHVTPVNLPPLSDTSEALLLKNKNVYRSATDYVDPFNPCPELVDKDMKVFKVSDVVSLRLAATAAFEDSLCKIHIKQGSIPDPRHVSGQVASHQTLFPNTQPVYKLASDGSATYNWYIIGEKIGTNANRAKLLVTKDLTSAEVLTSAPTDVCNDRNPGRLSVFKVVDAIVVKVLAQGLGGNCNVFMQQGSIPSTDSCQSLYLGKLLEPQGTDASCIKEPKEPTYVLAEQMNAATTWFIVGQKVTTEHNELSLTVTVTVAAAEILSDQPTNFCVGNLDKSLTVHKAVNAFVLRIVASGPVDPTQCSIRIGQGSIPQLSASNREDLTSTEPKYMINSDDTGASTWFIVGQKIGREINLRDVTITRDIENAINVDDDEGNTINPCSGTTPNEMTVFKVHRAWVLKIVASEEFSDSLCEVYVGTTRQSTLSPQIGKVPSLTSELKQTFSLSDLTKYYLGAGATVTAEPSWYIVGKKVTTTPSTSTFVLTRDQTEYLPWLPVSDRKVGHDNDPEMHGSHSTYDVVLTFTTNYALSDGMKIHVDWAKLKGTVVDGEPNIDVRELDGNPNWVAVDTVTPPAGSAYTDALTVSRSSPSTDSNVNGIEDQTQIIVMKTNTQVPALSKITMRFKFVQVRVIDEVPTEIVENIVGLLLSDGDPASGMLDAVVTAVGRPGSRYAPVKVAFNNADMHWNLESGADSVFNQAAFNPCPGITKNELKVFMADTATVIKYMSKGIEEQKCKVYINFNTLPEIDDSFSIDVTEKDREVQYKIASGTKDADDGEENNQVDVTWYIVGMKTNTEANTGVMWASRYVFNILPHDDTPFSQVGCSSDDCQVTLNHFDPCDDSCPKAVCDPDDNDDCATDCATDCTVPSSDACMACKATCCKNKAVARCIDMKATLQSMKVFKLNNAFVAHLQVKTGGVYTSTTIDSSICTIYFAIGKVPRVEAGVDDQWQPQKEYNLAEDVSDVSQADWYIVGKRMSSEKETGQYPSGGNGAKKGRFSVTADVKTTSDAMGLPGPINPCAGNVGARFQVYAVKDVVSFQIRAMSSINSAKCTVIVRQNALPQVKAAPFFPKVSSSVPYFQVASGNDGPATWFIVGKKVGALSTYKTLSVTSRSPGFTTIYPFANSPLKLAAPVLWYVVGRKVGTEDAASQAAFEVSISKDHQEVEGSGINPCPTTNSNEKRVFKLSSAIAIKLVLTGDLSASRCKVWVEHSVIPDVVTQDDSNDSISTSPGGHYMMASSATGPVDWYIVGVKVGADANYATISATVDVAASTLAGTEQIDGSDFCRSGSVGRFTVFKLASTITMKIQASESISETDCECYIQHSKLPEVTAEVKVTFNNGLPIYKLASEVTGPVDWFIVTKYKLNDMTATMTIEKDVSAAEVPTDPTSGAPVWAIDLSLCGGSVEGRFSVFQYAKTEAFKLVKQNPDNGVPLHCSVYVTHSKTPKMDASNTLVDETVTAAAVTVAEQVKYYLAEGATGPVNWFVVGRKSSTTPTSIEVGVNQAGDNLNRFEGGVVSQTQFGDLPDRALSLHSVGASPLGGTTSSPDAGKLCSGDGLTALHNLRVHKLFHTAAPRIDMLVMQLEAGSVGDSPCDIYVKAGAIPALSDEAALRPQDLVDPAYIPAAGRTGPSFFYVVGKNVDVDGDLGENTILVSASMTVAVGEKPGVNSPCEGDVTGALTVYTISAAMALRVEAVADSLEPDKCNLYATHNGLPEISAAHLLDFGSAPELRSKAFKIAFDETGAVDWFVVGKYVGTGTPTTTRVEMAADVSGAATVDGFNPCPDTLDGGIQIVKVPDALSVTLQTNAALDQSHCKVHVNSGTIPDLSSPTSFPDTNAIYMLASATFHEVPWYVVGQKVGTQTSSVHLTVTPDVIEAEQPGSDAVNVCPGSSAGQYTVFKLLQALTIRLAAVVPHDVSICKIHISASVVPNPDHGPTPFTTTAARFFLADGETAAVDWFVVGEKVGADVNVATVKIDKSVTKFDEQQKSTSVQGWNPCPSVHAEAGLLLVLVIKSTLVLKMEPLGAVSPDKCKIYLKTLSIPSLIPDNSIDFQAKAVYRGASGVDKAVDFYVVAETVTAVGSLDIGDITFTRDVNTMKQMPTGAFQPCPGNTEQGTETWTDGEIRLWKIADALAIKIQPYVADRDQPVVQGTVRDAVFKTEKPDCTCLIYVEVNNVPSLNSGHVVLTNNDAKYKIASGYAVGQTWVVASKKVGTERPVGEITISQSVADAPLFEPFNPCSNVEDGATEVFKMNTVWVVMIKARQPLDAEKCRVYIKNGGIPAFSSQYEIQFPNTAAPDEEPATSDVFRVAEGVSEASDFYIVGQKVGTAGNDVTLTLTRQTSAVPDAPDSAIKLCDNVDNGMFNIRRIVSATVINLVSNAHEVGVLLPDLENCKIYVGDGSTPAVHSPSTPSGTPLQWNLQSSAENKIYQLHDGPLAEPVTWFVVAKRAGTSDLELQMIPMFEAIPQVTALAAGDNFCPVDTQNLLTVKKIVGAVSIKVSHVGSTKMDANKCSIFIGEGVLPKTSTGPSNSAEMKFSTLNPRFLVGSAPTDTTWYIVGQKIGQNNQNSVSLLIEADVTASDFFQWSENSLDTSNEWNTACRGDVVGSFSIAVVYTSCTGVADPTCAEQPKELVTAKIEAKGTTANLAERCKIYYQHTTLPTATSDRQLNLMVDSELTPRWVIASGASSQQNVYFIAQQMTEIAWAGDLKVSEIKGDAQIDNVWGTEGSALCSSNEQHRLHLKKFNGGNKQEIDGNQVRDGTVVMLLQSWSTISIQSCAIYVSHTAFPDTESEQLVDFSSSSGSTLHYRLAEGATGKVTFYILGSKTAAGTTEWKIRPSEPGYDPSMESSGSVNRDINMYTYPEVKNDKGDIKIHPCPAVQIGSTTKIKPNHLAIYVVQDTYVLGLEVREKIDVSECKVYVHMGSLPTLTNSDSCDHGQQVCTELGSKQFKLASGQSTPQTWWIVGQRKKTADSTTSSILVLKKDVDKLGDGLSPAKLNFCGGDIDGKITLYQVTNAVALRFKPTGNVLRRQCRVFASMSGIPVPKVGCSCPGATNGAPREPCPCDTINNQGVVIATADDVAENEVDLEDPQANVASSKPVFQVAHGESGVMTWYIVGVKITTTNLWAGYNEENILEITKQLSGDQGHIADAMAKNLCAHTSVGQFIAYKVLNALVLKISASDTLLDELCKVYIKAETIPNINDSDIVSFSTTTPKYVLAFGKVGPSAWYLVGQKTGIQNSKNDVVLTLVEDVKKATTIANDAAVIAAGDLCSGTEAGKLTVFAKENAFVIKLKAPDGETIDESKCALYVRHSLVPSLTDTYKLVNQETHYKLSSGVTTPAMWYIVGKKIGDAANTHSLTVTADVDQIMDATKSVDDRTGIQLAGLQFCPQEQGSMKLFKVSKALVLKLTSSATIADDQCKVYAAHSTIPELNAHLPFAATRTTFEFASNAKGLLDWYVVAQSMRGTMSGLDVPHTGTFTVDKALSTFAAQGPNPCPTQNHGQYRIFKISAGVAVKLTAKQAFSESTCITYVRHSKLPNQNSLAKNRALMDSNEVPQYKVASGVNQMVDWFVVGQKVGTEANSLSLSVSIDVESPHDGLVGINPCPTNVDGETRTFKVEAAFVLKLVSSAMLGENCKVFVGQGKFPDVDNSEGEPFASQTTVYKLSSGSVRSSDWYIIGEKKGTSPNSVTITLTRDVPEAGPYLVVSASNPSARVHMKPCDGDSGKMAVYKIPAAVAIRLTASEKIDSKRCAVFVGTGVVPGDSTTNALMFKDNSPIYRIASGHSDAVTWFVVGRKLGDDPVASTLTIDVDLSSAGIKSTSNSQASELRPCPGSIAGQFTVFRMPDAVSARIQQAATQVGTSLKLTSPSCKVRVRHTVIPHIGTDDPINLSKAVYRIASGAQGAVTWYLVGEKVGDRIIEDGDEASSMDCDKTLCVKISSAVSSISNAVGINFCPGTEEGVTSLRKVEMTVVLKLVSSAFLDPTKCKIWVRQERTPDLASNADNVPMPDNDLVKFRLATGVSQGVEWYIVGQKIGAQKQDVHVAVSLSITEPANGYGPLADAEENPRPSPIDPCPGVIEGEPTVFKVTSAVVVKLQPSGAMLGEVCKLYISGADCENSECDSNIIPQADNDKSLIPFSQTAAAIFRLASGAKGAVDWFVVGKKVGETANAVTLTITNDLGQIKGPTGSSDQPANNLCPHTVDEQFAVYKLDQAVVLEVKTDKAMQGAGSTLTCLVYIKHETLPVIPVGVVAATHPVFVNTNTQFMLANGATGPVDWFIVGRKVGIQANTALMSIQRGEVVQGGTDISDNKSADNVGDGFTESQCTGKYGICTKKTGAVFDPCQCQDGKCLKDTFNIFKFTKLWSLKITAGVASNLCPTDSTKACHAQQLPEEYTAWNVEESKCKVYVGKKAIPDPILNSVNGPSNDNVKLGQTNTVYELAEGSDTEVDWFIVGLKMADGKQADKFDSIDNVQQKSGPPKIKVNRGVDSIIPITITGDKPDPIKPCGSQNRGDYSIFKVASAVVVYMETTFKDDDPNHFKSEECEVYISHSQLPSLSPTGTDVATFPSQPGTKLYKLASGTESSAVWYIVGKKIGSGQGQEKNHEGKLTVGVDVAQPSTVEPDQDAADGQEKTVCEKSGDKDQLTVFRIQSAVVLKFQSQVSADCNVYLSSHKIPDLSDATQMQFGGENQPLTLYYLAANANEAVDWFLVGQRINDKDLSFDGVKVKVSIESKDIQQLQDTGPDMELTTPLCQGDTDGELEVYKVEAALALTLTFNQEVNVDGSKCSVWLSHTNLPELQNDSRLHNGDSSLVKYEVATNVKSKVTWFIVGKKEGTEAAEIQLKLRRTIIDLVGHSTQVEGGAETYGSDHDAIEMLNPCPGNVDGKLTVYKIASALSIKFTPSEPFVIYDTRVDTREKPPHCELFLAMGAIPEVPNDPWPWYKPQATYTEANGIGTQTGAVSANPDVPALRIKDAQPHYQVATGKTAAVDWYLVGRRSLQKCEHIDTQNCVLEKDTWYQRTKATLTIRQDVIIASEGLGAPGKINPCTSTHLPSMPRSIKVFKVTNAYVLKLTPDNPGEKEPATDKFQDKCEVYVQHNSIPVSSSNDLKPGSPAPIAISFKQAPVFKIGSGKSYKSNWFVVGVKIGNRASLTQLTLTKDVVDESDAIGDDIQACPGIVAGKLTLHSTKDHSSLVLKLISTSAIEQEKCKVFISSVSIPSVDDISNAVTVGRRVTKYLLADGATNAVKWYIVGQKVGTALNTAKIQLVGDVVAPQDGLNGGDEINPCHGTQDGHLTVYKVSNSVSLSIAASAMVEETKCDIYVMKAAVPAMTDTFKVAFKDRAPVSKMATGQTGAVHWFVVGKKVGTAENTVTVLITKLETTVRNAIGKNLCPSKSVGQLTVYKASHALVLQLKASAAFEDVSCMVWLQKRSLPEVNFSEEHGHTGNLVLSNTDPVFKLAELEYAAVDWYVVGRKMDTSVNLQTVLLSRDVVEAKSALTPSLNPCDTNVVGKLSVFTVPSAIVVKMLASAAIDPAKCRIFVDTKVPKVAPDTSAVTITFTSDAVVNDSDITIEFPDTYDLGDVTTATTTFCQLEDGEPCAMADVEAAGDNPAATLSRTGNVVLIEYDIMTIASNSIIAVTIPKVKIPTNVRKVQHLSVATETAGTTLHYSAAVTYAAEYSGDTKFPDTLPLYLTASDDASPVTTSVQWYIVGLKHRVVASSSSLHITNDFETWSYALTPTSSFDTGVGPASGGSPVTINGNAFVTSEGDYKCRFTSGTESMDSATVTPTSFSRIICRTPAWGSKYTAKKTTITLIKGETTVVKTTSLESSFRFTEDWSHLSSNHGSVSGGLPITVYGSGFDPYSSYTCSFSGWNYDVTVTFNLVDRFPNDGKIKVVFPSGCDVSGDVTQTTMIDGVPATGDAPTVHASQQIVTVGPYSIPTLQGVGNTHVAKGSTIVLTIKNVKIPEASSKSGMLRVQTQDNEGIDVVAYPTSGSATYAPIIMTTPVTSGEDLNLEPRLWSSVLMCKTPTWGATYMPTILSVSLLKGAEQVPTLNAPTYSTVEATNTVSLSVAPASGGDTVVVQASGLDTGVKNYRCEFIAGDQVMASVLAQPSKLTQITCVTPAWGSKYSATTVKVLLKRESVSFMDEGMHTTSIKFVEAWSKASTNLGPLSGGTKILITGYGFRMSDDDGTTYQYTCRFRQGDGSKEKPFRHLDGKAYATSSTKLTCTTPNWSEIYNKTKHERPNTIMTLRDPKSSILVKVTGGDADFTFSSWEEFGSVRWQSTRGHSNGGTKLVVRGYGFDDTARDYRCKFTARDKTCDEPGASCRFMWSQPVRPSSSAVLTCTTPNWGAKMGRNGEIVDFSLYKGCVEDGDSEEVETCTGSSEELMEVTYNGDRTDYYNSKKYNQPNKTAAHPEYRTWVYAQRFTFSNAASVTGDPHFMGFHGEKYDVHGEPRKVYNILTDGDVQYNAWFLPYTHQYAHAHDDGTVIGAAGIKVGRNRIYFDKDGKVALNGKQLKKGLYELGGGAGTIDFKSDVKLTVKSKDYTIQLAIKEENIPPSMCANAHRSFPCGRRRLYLNHRVTINQGRVTLMEQGGMGPHGLLGQTAAGEGKGTHGKVGARAQGQGTIQGMYRDYEVRSGDIFGDDFTFNMYGVKDLQSLAFYQRVNPSVVARSKAQREALQGYTW